MRRPPRERACTASRIDHAPKSPGGRDYASPTQTFAGDSEPRMRWLLTSRPDGDVG